MTPIVYWYNEQFLYSEQFIVEGKLSFQHKIRQLE